MYLNMDSVRSRKKSETDDEDEDYVNRPNPGYISHDNPDFSKWKNPDFVNENNPEYVNQEIPERSADIVKKSQTNETDEEYVIQDNADYMNQDNPDYINEQFSKNGAQDLNQPHPGPDTSSETGAATPSSKSFGTEKSSGRKSSVGYMRAIHKPRTHGYLVLDDFLGETDADAGSNMVTEDYTEAITQEDYVEPLQEMMQPQRDKRQKRPLPPPPTEGMPGSGILPPTIPSRRGEPQNEGQIAYANNSDSGPTPPPLPPSRNHSGNNLNAQLNAHLNSRSPPPHPPVSRTPSGEQPPPLPPGRRGIPNFPAPEAPRQPLPPTPGPPPRIPTTQSRPLPAKPCPERPLPGRPGPGRPGPGRPSDFIKHEPPPAPEDDVEDVYIDPDAGEEYEELPQEEPPSISQNHPATPTQRNRPLPPAPSSNTPPALPPSNKTPNTDRRFQRPPQPLPPAPTPAAPPRPEPENNLQSLLKGVQLRPTGGPAGKNKQANNNLVDSNKPDKQPGFNTIKAAFQERTPIIPKRGSVESNQSSEESSGSGEFPVTPRGAQANNKNSPSSIPSLPNRGLPPRVPSPTPSPPADALCSFVWYFGDIRRADADSKIQFTKDGMFLVRRSKNGGEKNPYTLVVWCESKVWNVHIRLRTDRKYAVGSARDNEQTFSTIPELVDFHKSTPILLASEQGGRKVGQTKLKTSPSK